jgi:hypothetical protein
MRRSLNRIQISHKYPVEDIASESSIICVTESHLDTNIVDNDIIIDGFSDQIRWSVNSAY